MNGCGKKRIILLLHKRRALEKKEITNRSTQTKKPGMPAEDKTSSDDSGRRKGVCWELEG